MNSQNPSLTLWIKDFKYLFSNRTFLAILVIFSLTKGSFIALGGVLVSVLNNLDYSLLFGSITISSGVFLGLIGSLVFSRIFGQSQYKRLSLCVIIGISLLCNTLSFLFLSLQIGAAFITMYSLTSLLWYLAIPLMLEFAAKAKFQASKLSVNGFLMGCAMLLAFFVEFLSGFLLKKEEGSFIILLIVIVFNLTCLIVLNKLLKLD